MLFWKYCFRRNFLEITL